MSDVFIPFNHQPFATEYQATTKTIAAGEYARVTVSCFQFAYVSAYVGPGFTLTQNNDKTEFNYTVWLKSGDVILVSKTDASGTDANTSSSFSSTRNGSISILVNGDTVKYVETRSTICGSATAPIAYSVTHSGSTDFRILIERYKELT